jgi:hypothetical protein
MYFCGPLLFSLGFSIPVGVCFCFLVRVQEGWMRLSRFLLLSMPFGCAVSGSPYLTALINDQFIGVRAKNL